MNKRVSRPRSPEPVPVMMMRETLVCIKRPRDDVSSARERWVLLKIPRGDIDEVGEDEVTVTSGLHTQAERTNKQTEERGLHPMWA